MEITENKAITIKEWIITFILLALPIVNLESIADLKRNCGLPCTCPDLSCLGPDDGGPN